MCLGGLSASDNGYTFDLVTLMQTVSAFLCTSVYNKEGNQIERYTDFFADGFERLALHIDQFNSPLFVEFLLAKGSQKSDRFNNCAHRELPQCRLVDLHFLIFMQATAGFGE